MLCGTCRSKARSDTTASRVRMSWRSSNRSSSPSEKMYWNLIALRRLQHVMRDVPFEGAVRYYRFAREDVLAQQQPKQFAEREDVLESDRIAPAAACYAGRAVRRRGPILPLRA